MPNSSFVMFVNCSARSVASAILPSSDRRMIFQTRSSVRVSLFSTPDFKTVSIRLRPSVNFPWASSRSMLVISTTEFSTFTVIISFSRFWGTTVSFMQFTSQF